MIKLRDALYFQLNERVSFIEPKDKIVGLLLFELGNILALTDDLTIALRTYERAMEYGHESEVMEKRYEKFRLMHKDIINEFEKKHQLRVQNAVTKSAQSAQYYVLGGFILSTAILMFWIRRQG